MKGAISNQGNLFISRPRPLGGNKFEYLAIKAECPFTTRAGVAGYCGDHCPSFHEPQGRDDGKEASIEICSGTIIFDEFKDDRKGQ